MLVAGLLVVSLMDDKTQRQIKHNTNPHQSNFTQNN